MDLMSAVASQLAGAIFDLKNIIFLLLVFYFFKTVYKHYLELGDNIGHYRLWRKRKIIEEIVLTYLVCGFILSAVSLTLGITISQEAFIYYLFIALALTVINIRYISFVYSGGILILAGLIPGGPTVDSTSVLILMAFVQLIEGILVYIHKGRESIPVYIKDNGGITGAFVIHKYWPLPIAFFTFASDNAGFMLNPFNAQWWKVMKPEIIFPLAAFFALDSLIGVGGYMDVAVSESPKRRSIKISGSFIIYSMFIGVFAVISRYFSIFGIIGAVLCPAGRELMLYIHKKRQQNKEPIYKPVGRGIRILDVFPGGSGCKLGLERGDIVLRVNNRDVQTVEGLTQALTDFPRYVWIDIKKPDGRSEVLSGSFFPQGIDKLGIITVPREHEVTYNIDTFENLILIKNLVNRFRGFGKSSDNK